MRVLEQPVVSGETEVQEGSGDIVKQDRKNIPEVTTVIPQTPPSSQIAKRINFLPVVLRAVEQTVHSSAGQPDKQNGAQYPVQASGPQPIPIPAKFGQGYPDFVGKPGCQ